MLIANTYYHQGLICKIFRKHDTRQSSHSCHIWGLMFHSTKLPIISKKSTFNHHHIDHKTSKFL